MTQEKEKEENRDDFEFPAIPIAAESVFVIQFPPPPPRQSEKQRAGREKGSSNGMEWVGEKLERKGPQTNRQTDKQHTELSQGERESQVTRREPDRRQRRRTQHSRKMK